MCFTMRMTDKVAWGGTWGRTWEAELQGEEYEK
jgi:hypothetical protein